MKSQVLKTMTTIETSKTRRQLMREKISNLCAYMAEQFPDKHLKIAELSKYDDQVVVQWIFSSILPYAENIPELVERLCKNEGISPSKEIKQKLILYCRFFIELVQS